MPVQGDAGKIYRYGRIIDRIAQVQNQMRALRFQLELLIRHLSSNPDFIPDVQGLPAGDYVISAANSPRKEELLQVLRALLSYAMYAGHLTQEQFAALTGNAQPVPPDQISQMIDAWVRE